MSSTTGNTKELDTTRKEALRGVLDALGLVSNNPSSDARLSAEQLQKLSENIGEILGDDVDHGQAQGNQRSQLVNEEGLPIIDISEPVNEDSQTTTSPPYISEQDLIPFSLLPRDEKERRRRERDRILDLLEEEERLQLLQEERNAEEERKEAIRKRKESAKAKLEQLKAAQELQKKMGRALVQNVDRSGKKEKDEDARSKPRVASLAVKKSVSFTNMHAVEDGKEDQPASICKLDWGDVTPGRLRAQNRIPLVSAAEAQKYPMKMHVVERHFTATPSHNNADSDDELPSSDRLSPQTGNDSSDVKRSSSCDGSLSDGESLEDRFDYDAAQHHREIALEYHKKRNAIGAEAAKAMAAYTLDDYEQRETPLLSRFRADRMTAVYDKSHGLENVVPASRQKSLQNSVRLGKLEYDQLVGGEPGESGSEDDTVREVVQMLRTGCIQNAGPDFKSSSMPTIVPHQNSGAKGSTTVGTSTATRRAKLSRLVRGGGTIEKTPFQDSNSWDKVRSQPTISNVVERKAPRSSTSQHFPINKPPPRTSSKASELTPLVIIDSPSSPTTAGTSTVDPTSSLTWPITTGSSSPYQMQPERLSSGAQVSLSQPLEERPVSKFMAERKK